MYVAVDKKTGQLVLSLPARLAEYKAALEQELMDEFAFEALNAGVLARMNEYVRSWFTSRDVELPAEE
jgi:hypothetical protein